VEKPTRICLKPLLLDDERFQAFGGDHSNTRRHEDLMQSKYLLLFLSRAAQPHQVLVTKLPSPAALREDSANRDCSTRIRPPIELLHPDDRSLFVRRCPTIFRAVAK
jgi:hypothetical protein